MNGGALHVLESHPFAVELRVSERLRATRLQLLDMYSPVAKGAGA
jgi:hypothetical protein